jgi:hypothetical protein
MKLDVEGLRLGLLTFPGDAARKNDITLPIHVTTITVQETKTTSSSYGFNLWGISICAIT